MTKSKSAEPQDEAAVPLSKSQAAATASVDDWAAAKFPPTRSGRPHPELYKHAAAAALHGWAEHAHHAGAPMKLSEADYEASLQAAATLSMPDGKAAKGKPPLRPKYKPHPAALSPHHPRSHS